MSKSILIIDDDEDDHLIMKEVLSNLGFESIYTLLDGAFTLGFLEQLKSNLPSLIILDYNMPKMNGLEVLAMIKLKYDIPVLLYTTTCTKDLVSAAKMIGAVACIQKATSNAETRELEKLVIKLLEDGTV
jgi:CheY-like chemotaxis protein